MQLHKVAEEKLDAASQFVETDPERAYNLATDVLNSFPDDPVALGILAYLHSKKEHVGIAYRLAKTALEFDPTRLESWITISWCYDRLARYKEGREAICKCWELDFDKERRMEYLSNIAASYNNEYDFDKSLEWCEKALAANPDSDHTKFTLGMCQCAKGLWVPGLDNFDRSVRLGLRKCPAYQGEPLWIGQYVDTLLVIGEQGIGDEILFMSMLEDTLRYANRVIVLCNPRLINLFEHSFKKFPTIHFFPSTPPDKADFLKEFKIDASILMFSLARYLRKSDDQFPGTPYIYPTKHEKLNGKRLIGFNWEAGGVCTNRQKRELPIEAFKLLKDNIDASFVSLNPQEVPPQFVELGLQDTGLRYETDMVNWANLIQACDEVISIHCTATHLSCAMGIPTTLFLPDKTFWNYQYIRPGTDQLVWYNSSHVFRQNQEEPWLDTVKRYVECRSMKELTNA